jgi:hypothetical protein
MEISLARQPRRTALKLAKEIVIRSDFKTFYAYIKARRIKQDELVEALRA